jgi:hypothetical protein
MSLDTERLHRLKGKSFDTLYASAPQKYQEMADKALEYAKTCVPPGEKVRPGDVVAVIQNAVRIDPAFEAHLKQRSLTQKYWQLWFAEYIVEQVYPQPELKPAEPPKPAEQPK